jgi:hypothetical protein
MRLFYFLFLRNNVVHFSQIGVTLIYKQPVFIKIALIGLVGGSLFSGFFLMEFFGTTSDIFINSTVIKNNIFFENEFLP